ncbi:flagellar export chaperone FliS [Polaromonas sp. CG_9.11]|uniref:flagellar export chaperone FliS n=1 Tax=Polaromonas sp. CG_9.11 TaxID=2787730 RepID=UPI0018CB47B4|nr:flagellar export chaperone FliS [Polaromonas sp. CG_9.11]MBG6077617.1 flagellar protein FliS [Polaromonas sp. CG_9.11]
MYTRTAAPGAGARSYAQVGLQSGVMSASPHQLITLLFDGAKTAIAMARHHMAQKEIAAKGQAISKAINIIDNGLKASLDAEAGGPAGAELVANLSALYDYINQRLMQANLRNDPALLDEAERLLENIGSAWREIDPQKLQSMPEASNDHAAPRFSAGA